MSAREPAETRRYHETNMPRRDPISQAVINRHHGKEVDDEFSSKLPEMNPETAKHFAKSSEETQMLTNEIIPKLVNRLSELEKSQKQSEDLAIKRDKEINSKFDQVLAALGSLTGAKPARKSKKPAETSETEDFQGEGEDDGLPPAEK